jgi:pimeloyl-ACP methyl ester carboxylesterase
MGRSISLAISLCLLVGAAFAQIQQPNSITFTFTDEKYTDNKPIKLEGFEYIPKTPNGKVIVFLHGSAGGTNDQRFIKESIKFLNTSKYALENGYTFVPFMRKGRGKSEGEFTEETEKCGWGNTLRQIDEAERQVSQVLEQVRAKYGVQKVVLMGHSRGGFMSAYYAAKHPEQVSAVVNLAGVWNAECEFKNGGMASRKLLEESAQKFKPQLWAYFEYDTYFMSDKFNDQNYEWLGKTARDNGLIFQVFPSIPPRDGHDTPTWYPKEWATTYFPKLNEVTK